MRHHGRLAPRCFCRKLSAIDIPSPQKSWSAGGWASERTADAPLDSCFFYESANVLCASPAWRRAAAGPPPMYRDPTYNHTIWADIYQEMNAILARDRLASASIGTLSFPRPLL